MKYRPPLVGEQTHGLPLAAVAATLAIVRRLLERAACQRVRLLRRAAHSRGIRDWNSYLPAAGVPGRRHPRTDGADQCTAPHNGLRTAAKRDCATATRSGHKAGASGSSKSPTRPSRASCRQG